jgi:hypothetical protein
MISSEGNLNYDFRGLNIVHSTKIMAYYSKSRKSKERLRIALAQVPCLGLLFHPPYSPDQASSDFQLFTKI